MFVRCEGVGVSKPLCDGGGLINCQYTADIYEKFYIYPPEMPPFLTADTNCLRKVVIESAHWENVFIRLDGRETEGGWIVNCQFGVGPYEIFFLREEGETDVYSIISAAFPYCRIGVDGNGVKMFTGSGDGKVDVRYYDSMFSPAASSDKLKIADFQLQH